MSAKPASNRRRIFKLVLASVVLGSVLIAILAAEWYAGRMIRNDKQYSAAREVLSGKTVGAHLNRRFNIVGYPYLLYIPTPNNEAKGHNRFGFRGPEVPVERKAGVPRILFIGGSTTYGWSVGADESYPARVGEILRERFKDRFKEIEIINAGLPFGMTAEHVTHYHFKYHYFAPDIVVINAGGNDAQIAPGPFYQPDFSHGSRVVLDLRPLPERCRWIMKSNIAGLFMLQCFEVRNIGVHEVPDPGGKRPPTGAWFEPGGRPLQYNAPIEDKYWGFAHNMTALLDEIERDGAKIVLVPFRPAPPSQFPPDQQAFIVREEEWVRKTAQEKGYTLAPFPDTTISAGNWVDNCHLNAAGESEKARHVGEFIIPLLEDAELAARVASAPSPRD